MRTTNPIVPRDNLLIMLAHCADLDELPVEVDEHIEATLDLLNAADEIREEIDACEAGWLKVLRRLGVDPKRCPQCRGWLVSRPVGRPMVYCSVDCKTRARRTAKSRALVSS